jgi:hypothetical protein
MPPIPREVIEPFARKYIWWKSPEAACEYPHRVIAQLMDIGDYSDVQALAAQVGETVLADVVAHAEAGEFSPRSWAYWHYRLHLAELGQVPAMPLRKIA